MDVRLLGPVEVVEGDRRAVLGGPRHRAVLGMLALAVPDVVSTDRIVDGLWGERPPEKPLASLQVFIHKLRRGLADLTGQDGHTLLESRAPGYRLALPPEEIDAVRFEVATTRARVHARTGEHQLARQELEEALALWRGPALQDVREMPFAEVTVARLDELRLTAEDDLVDATLATGGHIDVVARLEARVREHPTRERSWGQLMTALYRSDRQADALATYARARETLADELGIDPGEALQQLELSILRQDSSLAPVASAPTPASLLPDAAPRPVARVPALLTETFGRSELVAQVKNTLERPEARVVTLTGMGGSGKSRVATLAAGRWEEAGGAVCFLGVTEVTAPEQLLHELVLALGGRGGEDPLATLAESLAAATAADARPLVVLDNLEALADGRALVEQIAVRCPSLTILVTSRVALHVTGEHDVPVPPLPTPEPAATRADIDASPAVQLFTSRVRAAVPGFGAAEVSDDVASLCRLLDGVPLALELAAARVPMLGVARLGRELAEGLELLQTGSPAVPERHQNLLATIEWSYQRLDGVAQVVCDRLALFDRGFTLEALEAVNDDVPALLETLAEILEARLVRPVESRVAVRYVLLGTVRAFARRRLGAHADLDERRARLAHHLLGLLRSWREDLDGDQAAVVLGRFDDEAADVDAAVDWATTAGRGPLAGDLALAASPFWLASGRLGEARSRVDAVRRLDGLADETAARLAAESSWLSYQLTDWSTTLEEGRAVLRDEAADEASTVVARCAVAGALAMTGEVEEAAGLARETVNLAVDRDLYPWSAVAWSLCAIACAVRGDYVGEREAYEQRLILVRSHRDLARTADTLGVLAEIDLDEGDAASAQAYAEEALALAGARLPLEARDATVTAARAMIALGLLDDARERLALAVALTDRTGQVLALAQCLRTGALLADAVADHRTALRLLAAAQVLSPSPTGADEPAERDFAGAWERARTALGAAAEREWRLATALPASSARELLDRLLALQTEDAAP